MKVILIATGLMLAGPVSASTTLNFDAYSEETPIYNDGGLDFVNFSSLDTTGFTASGYVNSVTSGTNIAFNPSGKPTTISGAPFRLVSASLAAAWNDGLTVQFVGTLYGNAVYTERFAVDTAHAAFETFNSSYVDQIVISTYGGTHNQAFGINHGTQFSLDDLTFQRGLSLRGSVGNVGGVPEPATWALMVSGFGLIGVTIRRRRAGEVVAA